MPRAIPSVFILLVGLSLYSAPAIYHKEKQQNSLNFKPHGYGFGGLEEWNNLWFKLKSYVQNNDLKNFYSLCSCNLEFKIDGKVKIITKWSEFKRYIIYLKSNSFYSYVRDQNPSNIDVNENGISTKYGVFWIGNKHNSISPVDLEIETINLNYLPNKCKE